MTRSIPSIIVLTLMCFTISYGLVRFPDAGILDAAQSNSASTDPQAVTVMRQTADGSALQTGDLSTSSALPEMQTPSSELFGSQSTGAGSANDSSNTAVENAPVNNSSSNSNGNAGNSNGRNTARNDQGNPGTERLPNNIARSDAGEASYQETGLKNDSPEQNNPPISAIRAPDNDDFFRDNSMPIEVDQNPLFTVGPIDTDIPQVQVPSTPPESEQNLEPEIAAAPEPTTEPDPITEPDQNQDNTSDEGQSAEDYWNEYFDSVSVNESVPSANDSAANSTNPNAAENQPVAPSAPSAITADPNAVEIPPQTRETKPANKDAITMPAVPEPQNNAPKSDQPNNRTIPVEIIPLDDEPTQPVSYTTEIQQEPRDPFGFNVPAVGPIIVRRLPSVENSVDPIYNNAQLDRFAL